MRNVRVLVEIFSSVRYFILLAVVSLFVIAFAAWLPNLHLIVRVMGSSDMTVWQKTNLLGGLFASLKTNFTFFSRTIVFVSAFLTGVQVSLLVFYVRQTAKMQSSAGVSFIGVLVSMLGVGCASCGSVVLSSVIGLGSTGFILSFLPFKGQEFGLLGISILLFTVFLSLKKINNPVVCDLKE